MHGNTTWFWFASWQDYLVKNGCAATASSASFRNPAPATQSHYVYKSKKRLQSMDYSAASPRPQHKLHKKMSIVPPKSTPVHEKTCKECALLEAIQYAAMNAVNHPFKHLDFQLQKNIVAWELLQANTTRSRAVTRQSLHNPRISLDYPAYPPLWQTPKSKRASP